MKRKQAAKKTAATKRPNSTITFTEEQEAILMTEVPTGEILLIQAIAGSGKTSTVLEYMRRRPNAEFLYLAFNKAAADEARNRCKALGIKNVTCSTIDGLARKDRTINFRFSNHNPKAEFIDEWKRELAAQGPAMAELLEKAQVNKHMNAVWSTINKFAYSDSRELIAKDEDVLDHAQQIWSAIDTQRMYCPSFAWNCKLVAERGRLLTDFDWTTSNQNEHVPDRPVTHIIVDEAQDINWPMLKLVMNQLALPLSIIFCGDPFQHLYSFRHCISVFSDVNFSERFGLTAPNALHLSKSARFGSAIAQAATSVLSRMVEGHATAVIGTLNELREDKVISQKIGIQELRELIPEILDNKTGELALLFRTNRGLFETWIALEEIQCVAKTDELTKFTNLYKTFLADKTKFMQDYNKEVWKAEQPSDEEADTEEDAAERRSESLYLYELIMNTPQAKLPKLVERIAASRRFKNCRCILSTIHRAKGLEYDSVILSEDVSEYESIKLHYYNKKKRELADGIGSKKSIQKEAKALNDFYCLKYTGVTRAKYDLWIIKPKD